MKKIRTVLGDIAPEQLGYTLAHDHVICDQSLVLSCFFPDENAVKNMVPAFANRPADGIDCKLENLSFIQKGGWMLGRNDMRTDGDNYIDFIVKELEYYKAAGGSSIIEPTYDGLSRRTNADLVEISKRSGINIIACIGFPNPSFGLFPDRLKGKTEDEIKEILDEEVEAGMRGCGVKPGVLKALLSSGEDEELISFRALARVSAETGLPLTTHLQLPITIEQILKIVRIAVDEIGVSKDKLLLNHLNSYAAPGQMLADYVRTLDCKVNVDGIQKVLDTGVYISFDSFGNYSCQSNEYFGSYAIDEYATTNAVYQLLEKGYASQIMLGHDFCAPQMGVQNGGFGYTRVPAFVDPMLRQLTSDEAVDQMMIKNPMNFLAF